MYHKITYKRYLKRLPSLPGDLSINDFLPEKGDKLYLSNIRSGLYQVLKSLDLGKDRGILLPAFLPAGIYKPCRKLFRIKYYKSDRSLHPNAEDICQNLQDDPQIAIVIVIHYFGIVQDLERISQICRENDVLLIEDCAHALFSRTSGGKFAGGLGDISLYSFPKCLPVPDGCVILINNYEIRSKVRLSITWNPLVSLATRIHFFYLVLKRKEIQLRSALFSLLLNRICLLHYTLYYTIINNIYKPQKISKITLSILERFPYDDWLRRKECQIRTYHKSWQIQRYSQRLLKSDPSSVLIGIPVLSDDRDGIKHHLKKNRIECQTFIKQWYVAPRVKKMGDYTEEQNFSREHLLLPLDGFTTESETHHVLKTIYQYEQENPD